MANRIRGCEGSLHLTDTDTNKQLVADTQNMSINESASTESISIHGTCSQITVSSEVTYEISFDGLLSTDDLGQAEIQIGEEVPWTWYCTSDQTASGASYSGTFVVESIERSMPADGRCTFSVSGQGSGDLVRTNVW